ncbi:MAG TPA: hypothetical protein VKT17_09180 [Acidobacteriota bacterium]|nr:hypothetical protein [Acidobacteriota bacterium]
MRIHHPMSRTVACAALVLIFGAAAIAVVAAAQTQGSCPPIIASLFPKNATIVSGMYMPGDMGQGRGSADVSFDDPICPKQRFSARISLEVKHYGGETAILIKSAESPYGSIDREADKALAVQNAKGELAQTRLTPKTEKLGTGEIVYVERMSECPPEGPAQYAARVGPMIVPNVKLRGVAWTGNAKVEVKLDGLISVDLAKAAVAEIFANLEKADFSKAK